MEEEGKKKLCSLSRGQISKFQIRNFKLEVNGGNGDNDLPRINPRSEEIDLGRPGIGQCYTS